MGDNLSDIVEVLVYVIIAAASGIWVIIKKIDQWIQTHRVPRQMRDRGPGAPSPGPSPAPGRAQQEMRQGPEVRKEEHPAPAPRPMTMAEALMKELERALGGEAEEAEPAPVRRKPTPVPRPEAVSRPAAQHTTEREHLVRREKRAEIGTAPPASRAGVHRSEFAHLAVLRTPQDLKRAVILQEILGPPKALRRAPFPRA